MVRQEIAGRAQDGDPGEKEEGLGLTVQAHKMILHGVDDLDGRTWFEHPDQNLHRTRTAEWGLRQRGHHPGSSNEITFQPASCD